MAVQAYVLIRCEGAKAKQVVDEIRKKDHVRRANMVFGDYDAVARVSVRELPSSFSVQRLEEVIFDEIQKVSGVMSTNTHIVTSPDSDFEAD